MSHFSVQRHFLAPGRETQVKASGLAEHRGRGSELGKAQAVKAPVSFGAKLGAQLCTRNETFHKDGPDATAEPQIAVKM